jgi:asparagine synthetase B (glutamine-hydrolysing)
MKTLGGYFSFNKSKIKPDQIRTKLQAFKASSIVENASTSVLIEEYEYGHLFVTQKEHARSMVTTAKLANQDLFFSLGYLIMNDSIDWDVNQSKLRIPTPLPDNFGEMLPRAEGEFNAFYWDALRQQLHIVNDRFASRPLYILQTKERIFFCTNLPVLLHMTKLPVKLDPLGVMQLFMFMHSVDTYTHVESVTRLRPASRMILSDKGVSCRPYWKLQFDVSYDLNPQEFAKEVFSAFKKSVSDRAAIAQQGLFGLSGGLDSRFIAGCIPEPSRFPAFTVGSYNAKEDLEYQCAAEISRVYGFPHQQILLPPSDIPEFSRKIFMLSGNVTGMHAAAKFMRFTGMPTEFIFSGSPGDVIAGGYISSLYYTLPSRMEDILKSHTLLNNNRMIKFRQFIAPELVDEYAPKMQELLTETYANVSGPTAAHKVTAWWMTHYIPAFACSGPFNSYPGKSRVYPHLGYAYNDLMLKQPALWLYKKAFYKYMIYQSFPQIRHVCYANTGEYLKDSIPAAQLPMISYKLWAMRRRCESFFHKTSNIQPQQTFEFYMMQKNEKLWADIEEIIASYPDLRRYLNIPGIRKFVDLFRQIQPQDQTETLDYIKATSFLTAILYFYKYMHEL